MKSIIREPRYQGFVSLLVVLILSIINNSCNSASPSKVSPSPKSTGFAPSLRTPSYTLFPSLTPTPTSSPTSTPETYKWETHGPWGGKISALAIDPINPSILYAGTSYSGVFRSIDAGDHWKSSDVRMSEVSIFDLAVDPSTTSTVYAGTSSMGFYKSDNSGEDWIASNRGLPDNSAIDGITIDPISPSTIYIINVSTLLGYGIYKSEDDGETWNLIDNGIRFVHVTIIAINPLSPTTLYAGTEDGMFKTVDAGDHWIACNAGLPDDSRFQSLIIDPNNPNILYTSIYKKGIYKSEDNGDHWYPINNGFPIGFWARDLAIDPSDSSTIYAGTIKGIYRSIDGGKKWGLASSDLAQYNINTIIIDNSNPSILYAATGSGLFKSINNGDEWSLSNTGISATYVTSFLLHPTDPQVQYAGTDSMGLFRSPDNGKSWDSIDVGFSNPEIKKIIVDPVNPSIIYLALRTYDSFQESHYGVYKSIDKGVSWKPINVGLGSKGTISDMAIDPTDPLNLYLVQYDNAIYKTINGGLNWTKHTSGLSTPRDCSRVGLSLIAIVPSQPSNLFVLSDACGIYKSTDFGNHWEIIFSPANTWFYSLFIDPITSSIYVLVTDGKVFISDDGGISWHVSHSNLHGMSNSSVVITDPVTPTTLYAGTVEGVFMSTNFGDWICIGKFSVFVNTLSISLSTPMVLYAGTSSGVYSLKLVD